MTLHRCFIDNRPGPWWQVFGSWRAECSCGFKGRKRWHPVLAEREADQHLNPYSRKVIR